MRKFVLFVVIALLVAAQSAGCSRGQPQGSVPPGTPPVTTRPALPPGQLDTFPLEEQVLYLVDYIGEEDQKIVQLLGEGKASFAQDNKKLSTRSYELISNGQRYPTTVKYDDKQKVQLLQVMLVTGSYDDWLARFVNKIGEPLSKVGHKANQSSETKSAYWKVQKRDMVVQDVDGQISVAISKS